MNFACTVCGYLCSSVVPPEKCPICGAPREKFVTYDDRLEDLLSQEFKAQNGHIMRSLRLLLVQAKTMK